MGEKRSTEQAFQNYLRSGEQVRWHGTTKPFPLLERDARFLILGKWIGTGAVTAVLLRLYIGNSPDWSLKAVIAVLLVAALLIGLLDIAFFEGQYLLTGKGVHFFGGN